MKDDLTARLLELAENHERYGPYDHSADPCLLSEAAAHIAELEAQLAARDAEIVAWLRGDHGDWSVAARKFANDIERGEHLNRRTNNEKD